MASRLVFLRSAAGFSVRQIRHLAGVDSAYLWRLEKGKQENPSFETAEALGAVYGVRREWLLRGTGQIFAAPGESMDAFVNLPGVVKPLAKSALVEKLARDVAVRAAFFSSANSDDRERLANDIVEVIKYFADTASKPEQAKATKAKGKTPARRIGK